MSTQIAEKIMLGQSEVYVSPLGVGTNSWGSGGRVDARQKETLQSAVGMGINFFDTAEVYSGGGSERTLGAALKETGAGAVVATKFMPLPWRMRRSNLLEALRESLERLQLERVDLYMTHFPFPPMPVEVWMEAMAEAKEEELIRAVGVSNYNREQMRRAQVTLAKYGLPLASNQVEYSLLKRGAERSGLLEYARRLKVTLVAYRPLASGLLGGKYGADNPPPGIRGKMYNQATLRGLDTLTAKIREIAERYGKTSTQVALNWVICKGALPIPGATSPAHVEENAGALGWQLTVDEVAALDAASIVSGN